MKKVITSPVMAASKPVNKNVNLVKKNPDNWKIVAGPSGQYIYELLGTKVSGVFKGHSLVAGATYSLASYKEGNNIVVLGTGAVNANGDLQIMNAPIDIGIAQKWTGDYLGQPAGYKIWLVPTRDINGGIFTWRPNGFLFETSLAR